LRDEESRFASYLAYDLLAAIPSDARLSTAEDLVVGAEWSTPSIRVRADAYTKRMHNLVLPPLPSEPLDAPVIVAEGFRVGEGSAHGVELLAQHDRAGQGVSASYAFASAERWVGGDVYTPRFHRRHTLDVTGYRPLGARGQASARFILGSGQPYTPVVGIQQPFGFDPVTGTFTNQLRPTYILGEHNSERLPGYLRLDLAARKSYDRRWFGGDVTLTPYLQILNVLNTRNVLIAEPTPFAGAGGNRLRYEGQLPFLPTLGIEWKF
jgi:hypothetical protein